MVLEVRRVVRLLGALTGTGQQGSSVLTRSVSEHVCSLCVHVHVKIHQTGLISSVLYHRDIRLDERVYFHNTSSQWNIIQY